MPDTELGSELRRPLRRSVPDSHLGARLAQRPHRGASGAAVNEEVLGALGNLFVEVVHEHAHGRFLVPALAGERIAARSFDLLISGSDEFGVFNMKGHTD